MPGFDGTGPHGVGPITGGGRGYCAVLLPRSPRASTSGTAYAPYAGRWVAPYFGIAPGVTPEDELKFLRSRAQALKEYLEAIEARMQGSTSKRK